MKKGLIVLILFLFIAGSNNAQSDSLNHGKVNRFCLFIGGGLSLPVSQFKTYQPLTSINAYGEHNIAGEAQNGFSVKIGGRYLLGKHFGIAASLYSSSFKAKPKSVKEIYPVNTGYYTIDNGNEIGKWNANGFLIGAVYEVGKGKFKCGANVLAGIQMATSPETVMNFGYPPIDPPFGGNGYVSKVYQPAITKIGLAYNIGVYGAYNFSTRIGIRILVDYTGGSHKFGGKNADIERVDGGQGASKTYSSQNTQFKKDVTFLTIALGVGFSF